MKSGSIQLHRRQLLTGLAGWACAPAWGGDSPAATLLAAWQQGTEHRIGLLRAGGDRLALLSELRVPSRAHGLMAEGEDSVLVVARRPGDWLLRWHPRTGQADWRWVNDDRGLNGHAEVLPDSGMLLTTETDSGTGQGLLGVRDRATLEKRDEWPTHGSDPHQLLALPESVGPWPAGTVIVANGGINTRPETGRSKRLAEPMNASLVALDAQRGTLLGQWRLDDPYLSIRHLAWNPAARRLGIALQAEHLDLDRRKAAPVLAVWDGESLSPAQKQPPLEGYGGDIVAHPQGGFAVSCPRANTLALFSANGEFLRAIDQPLSYALAEHGGQWWNSGKSAVLVGQGPQTRRIGNPEPNGPTADTAWQLDNHWKRYVG